MSDKLTILDPNDSEDDFLHALHDPDSAVHVMIMKKDEGGISYQSCIIPGESAGIHDGHLATGLGHVLGYLYMNVANDLRMDIFTRFHTAFQKGVEEYSTRN